MQWVSYINYFFNDTASCLCTEAEESRTFIAAHLFENNILNKIQQHSAQPSSSIPYVTLVEVFVEKFIGATNNHNSYHLTHVSRWLLHGINPIFLPPEVTNHPGEDPISKKNYLKLMACGSP